MMGKRRILAAVLATAVAAAGVVRVAVFYRSGQGFEPFATDRALQNNQVLFSDEDTTTGADGQGGEENDSFWQEKNKENAAAGAGQGYLFGRDQQLPEGVASNGLLTNDPAASAGNTTTGGTAYEITDRGNADTDLIFPGSGGKDNGTSGQPGGSGGQSGGKTDADEDPQPTPSPAEPVPGYGSSSRDALQTDYVSPSYAATKSEHYGSFTAGKLQKNDDYEVRFTPSSAPNSAGCEALYKGQKNVDAATIFQSIEAFVWDKAADVNYYWTLDDLYTGPENEAESYVRITGVSFGYFADEPITEFPVDIPEEEDYIRIYLQYRISLEDEWSTYETEGWFGPEEGVSYELLLARVVVLDSILQKEGETIDPAHVINRYGQYADFWTTSINLLEYQKQVVGGRFTRLSTLFPGWKEDGESVPFFYPVTAGRHVLEPAAMVPLSEDYQVEVQTYWMDQDYAVAGVGESFLNAKYVYAQTLTDYHGADRVNDRVERLCVPQYIQAVQFNDYPGLTVDTLELSDTVLYVDTTGIPSQEEDELQYDRGLNVTQAYTVAEGNPRYTAEDGILYNLEMTQMLGVPTGRTTLTVPAQITKVVLPYQNQIRQLVLEGENLDDMPEINYQRLQRGACIVVPDALFSDYVSAVGTELQRYGIAVAPASQPDQGYLLRDSYLLTSELVLHSVQRSSAHWLSLPDYLTGVEAAALQPFIGQLEMLVLPANGQVLPLDDGCFDGFEKMTIACYSDEQAAAAQALSAQYPDCSFTIRRVTVREDGYAYLQLQGGVLLCTAPQDMELFDGTIPGENGGEALTVTVVGESAFAGSSTLRWVVLPEQTNGVGYAAFRGCTSLEGVLIGTTGSFLFGENAFADCAALRFLGSNAAGMVLEDPDFSLQDSANSAYGYLYCLSAGKENYNGNWTYLTDVDHYILQDCGATKMLYGADEKNTPFVALRSGGSLNGDPTLPATTRSIFRGAFANAHSVDDTAFDINWDDLTALQMLWREAFSHSDIGEDITISPNLDIGHAAFEYCEKLKSITLPGQLIVDNAPTGGLKLGDEVFINCPSLTTVRVGDVAQNSGIPATVFSGSAITELTFESQQPPHLLYYSMGMSFFFEYTQETQGLLHITVPQGCEQSYLKAWRCELAGFCANEEKTAYQVMWEEMEWQLSSALGVWPTTQQTMEAVEEIMLQSENRLRVLMGLPEVSTLQKEYTIAIGDDDMLTLTATDHVGSMTDLSAAVMNLPYGWTLDYIAAGAFEGSPELRGVQVPSTLFAIQAGAFRGLALDENDATDGLSLYLDSAESIFALMLQQEGTPFDFGVPDDRLRVLSMDVLMGDADALDTFVQLWTLPLAGYSTAASLETAVRETLGEEAEDEAVYAAMEAVLLPAENRVRTLLEAPATEELTFRFELTNPDDDTPAVDITVPEQPPETPDEPGPQGTVGEEQDTLPEKQQPEEQQPDALPPQEDSGVESGMSDEQDGPGTGEDGGGNTADDEQEAAAGAAQKKETAV